MTEERIETRSGESRKPELFAEILVAEGVLNSETLRQLLKIQQELPPGEQRVIGRLAVERGYLDESSFLALLDRHCRRLHLAELLVLRGLLTLVQVDEARQAQTASDTMKGVSWVLPQ